MSLARPILLLLIVAVLVFGFGILFFRYEFHAASEATVIWRGDRVTGGVDLCYSNAGRIQCEPYEAGRPWKP